MKNSKVWSICCLVLALLLLLTIGGMTALIDPYFHYHAPLDQLEYPLDNQRYQNDGIVKNFSYNAMITGTSMKAREVRDSPAMTLTTATMPMTVISSRSMVFISRPSWESMYRS